MKRERKAVNYSYEHGDETLPHICDLASDVPDIEKKTIIDYLKTNCVLCCPGIVPDEICPGKIIGSGHIYYDGTYIWNDVFINYVDRYNIPVPAEFRDHILKNHSARQKRHLLLRLVDRVEIHNNPYLGYEYNISINRNGDVKYRNNTDCFDEMVFAIQSKYAENIIDPNMKNLFCYDSDEHGTPKVDGHHWKITFFKGEKLLDEKEGWDGEDNWRYNEFYGIISFIERYIPKNLGTEYMNVLEDEIDMF